MSEPAHKGIDPRWYRQVLGQYPTGVCVVTAMRSASEPVAMVVGSFTSVSLAPPLVAFFPDRTSSSWAKLRSCKQFCINILSADQESVCRKLASKDPDKFTGTAHRISSRGNPVVEGVVAWIECDQYSISDAGDHEMVLGRVLELDISTSALPLLFFQGGYGKFAPSSLVASDSAGIALEQLRSVDCARPEMEATAAELAARCIATVRIGNELAVAASAGQTRRNSAATLVGQRLPFSPPTASIFAAWLAPAEQEKWLQRIPDDERCKSVRASLQLIRTRGYSVGLLNDAQRKFTAQLEAIAEGSASAAELDKLIEGLSYDPEELTPEALAAVRLISVPVLDSHGQVSLVLTLHDFPKPTSGIQRNLDRLKLAAARATALLARPLSGSTKLADQT